MIYLPQATRSHQLLWLWLIVIPVFFSDDEEVVDDKTTGDDLDHEEVDEEDIHKVEILPDHQQLRENDTHHHQSEVCHRLEDSNNLSWRMNVFNDNYYDNDNDNNNNGKSCPLSIIFNILQWISFDDLLSEASLYKSELFY